MKQKLLELISNSSMVTGYKVNIQKSIAFLYTSNEPLEFKIKNTIPFTLSLKEKEVLRYKCNKIFARSVCKKTYITLERNQRSK